jgi:hypothetical protein
VQAIPKHNYEYAISNALYAEKIFYKAIVENIQKRRKETINVREDVPVMDTALPLTK